MLRGGVTGLLAQLSLSESFIQSFFTEKIKLSHKSEREREREIIFKKKMIRIGGKIALCVHSASSFWNRR